MSQRDGSGKLGGGGRDYSSDIRPSYLLLLNFIVHTTAGARRDLHTQNSIVYRGCY